MTTIVFLFICSLPLPSLAADGVVSSSVDLKIWGRAVLNTHYDTDDVRGFTDFATYLTGEGEGEMNFNPRDTRFGFAGATENGGNNYRCVFEMDFYGSNAGNNLLPRMRLGYVEMKTAGGFMLRAGQDWIPVAKQNPGTIDFGILSWGGNLWWRVPQITATKKTGDVELLASLMKHR
ncbi:MAG: hypothetical protein ABIF77_09515, partial [bacterium]